MDDPKGIPPKRDYFKVKFTWFDAIIAYRIPGEQRQVLDFIIRKTYGWKKKRDGIALSQFVKATGIKKQNIHRAIKELEKKNLIKVIKSDDYTYLSYEFNKYFKTWKPVIKNDYSNQKRLRVSSKTITGESSKVMNTIDNYTRDTITKDKKHMSKVKTFDPHDISYLLSETLIDQIKRNLPNGKDVQNGNREKTIQRWASDIDKMIRLDNRPVCDIWNMIIWCHYDDFWFKNILSGSKLRKQYDKLSAAITSEVRRKNRNKTQHQKLLEVGERWLQKQGMQDS